MLDAILLAAVLLVAPPERTSYLFTLEGLPAGQVTLERSADGTSFTYRSEHVFGRGPALRTVEARTLTLDEAGRVAGSTATPVSFWLWTRHVPSCLEVMDERTGRTGQACSNAVSREELEGIALDESFHATYQDGVLEVLEMGPAHFVRIRDAPALDGARGLWAQGLRVQAGRGELLVEPPLPLARPPAAPSSRGRVWAERLLSDFGAAQPKEACLESAQRLLAYLEERGGHGVLVLGLLLDGGRAWPHAWVRAEGPYAETVDVDPAWARLVVPPGYLALETVAPGGHGLVAGQAYLELASGKRRLVRR
jgi:hypothetical protein